MLPASPALPLGLREILPPSLLSTQQCKVRGRSEIITCFRVHDGAFTARDAAIAAEVPVALAYFALGFSVSEGILSDANELLHLEIEDGQTGIRVGMTITRERFAWL